MARTVTDVQAELAIINGALQSLYAGTRVTELRIDTNILRRYHKFTEVTHETLMAQKTLLENELIALQGVEPTFRSFGNIPMVVGKQGIY